MPFYLSWFLSLFRAFLSLFGSLLFQQPPTTTTPINYYDAIVVGAGAGGCPLTQTLLEGGLRVLLMERGDEPPETSQSVYTFDQVLLSTCVETFFSKSEGVVLAAGKCMGGSTSINQGIWIEETAEWVQEQFGSEVDFATTKEIEAAYEWVRDRVARPTPTVVDAPNSASETYLQELLQAYSNTGDFVMGNVNTAQPKIGVNQVFRTYSIFDPDTRSRRSADTLLDRQHPNLDLRLGTQVARVLLVEGTPLRAQCVQLTSLETVCVQSPHGRIYLAGGAFHTPEILLRSGIGPQGKIVANSNVGQHLNDKPGMLLGSFPASDFDFPNDATISHIAAMRQKNETSSLLLFEQNFAGFDALLNVLNFERLFVPSHLRKSWYANVAATVLQGCASWLESDFYAWLGIAGPICGIIEPLYQARCTRRNGGLFSLVSEPQSLGTVTLGPGGDLQISVNYLTTAADVEAFGTLVRTSFQVLSSVQGTTTPQTGCRKEDPLVDDDDKCVAALSCPDLFVGLLDFVRNAVRLVDPVGADQIPDSPASSVTPPWIEPVVTSAAMDDAAVGERLRNTTLVTPQHFAGTAAVGRVLDRNFRVVGVEGLYVADASAITKTTRVNPMATVMMVGRLAGVKFLEEINQSSTSTGP